MNKKGFTLVEIIAVVVIMSILVIITGTNLIKKFNESKIETLIIQEGQLVQSGDMVIQDYCKDPLNEGYKLQCDELYKSYVDDRQDLIIDESDNTYMKYICINDLKNLGYYNEELQLSGENCSGVVVYKIDYQTDLQRDSFSVIRCGGEYTSEINKNKDYTTLFGECFTDQVIVEEEKEPEYTLTVNFTESTPSGLKVSQSYSKKHKKNEAISINVPDYETDYNEYKAFKHASSTNASSFNLNESRTILSGKMPAKDAVVNIVYGVSTYTLTINYKEYNDVEGNINFPSKNMTLYYGEEITIPYDNKDNFKIVQPKTLSYEMPQSDASIDVVYQQIEFDLIYPEDTGCSNRKVTFNENFGELCTPTRTGYTFKGWRHGGVGIKPNTPNTYYDYIELEPIWEANKYTVTFYMGEGNKEIDKYNQLGTMQCTYDSDCTLLSFDSFGKEFPYENYDPENNGTSNYGWEYAGWTNLPDKTNVVYEDNMTFKWNKTYNISLYAIGKREFNLYSGYNSSTNKAYKVKPNNVNDMIQYWNPYSHKDAYLSEIKFPAGIEIDGWTFIGYRDGRSSVNGSAGIPAGNSKVNLSLPTSIGATTFKPPVLTTTYIRSVYQRTLTLNYDLNGGNFSESGKNVNDLKQIGIQYYNTGIGGNDEWSSPIISPVTFKLQTNSGIVKTGHTFNGWLDGSKSGSLKSISSNLVFKPSVGSSASKTMYASWTKCNAGTYLSDNTCKTCAAGTYSNAGANSCTKCSAGTYSSAGASSCTNCAAGTYSVQGASSCSTCAAGYYCPGSSDKIACPAGTYRTSTGAKSKSDCTKCGVGTSSSAIGATSSNTCVTCAIGTYTDSEGNSVCKTCDAGSYCTGGSNKIECPAGTYNDSTGATDLSSCKQCSAGTYSSGKGNTKCSSCEAGKYSDVGSSSCLSCKAGYACKVTAGLSSMTILEPCPAGTYSNKTGLKSLDQCISCESGTTSVAGSTKCVDSTYNITYELNGGVQGSNPVTSYKKSTDTFNLPSPTKTGYTFAGWYTSSNFNGTKVTSITKGTTGDKKFYAKWDANYVKVVYHPNDATTIKLKGASKSVEDFEKETVQYVYYNKKVSGGLVNVQNNEWVYLEKTGYTITGNWYSGSIKLDQKTAITGQSLAEHFGLDISNGSVTLDLYPEWGLIDIKDVTPGSYVKYSGNDYTSWQVLFNEKGKLELVSSGSTESIQIYTDAQWESANTLIEAANDLDNGSFLSFLINIIKFPIQLAEDVAEFLRSGYGNSVLTLNNEAQKYINKNNFAESARCIGSTSKSHAQVGASRIVAAIFEVDTSKVPYTDYEYERDYDQLVEFNLVQSDKPVWLASRDATDLNVSGFWLYFAKIRVLKTNGKLDGYAVSHYTPLIDRGKTAGFRPVVTLKKGLKVVSGGGTQSDPYVLAAK